MSAAPSPYKREPFPILLVISGPSGVGKDALVRRMQEIDPSLHFVVTATTRPIRSGEVEGRDYFFVSKAQFAAMIEAGELLEHAIVYGDYKGIPRQQVRDALRSGRDVVMRVDVQGAATIRRLVPHARLLFLMAESEEALVVRLQKRSTEEPGQLSIRIATAREEIRRMDEFDYVVVNAEGKLDRAVEKIFHILDAERCRVHQQEVTL